MRMRSVPRAAACGLMAVVLVAGNGGAQDLPVVKGKKVVASVQGEPITLEEFTQQVAAMKRGQAPGAKADPREEIALLGRMIDLMLIAQEARRMDMDKLPEVRQLVESYARVTLREELAARLVKDVKADPKEVEEIYRASVRQWKVSAALFEKEEQAGSLAAEVAAGKPFAEAARAYLADGRAAKLEEGVLLSRAAMDPAIGKAIAGMALGSTSPAVATKSGLVVLTLEEIRYPDNAAERARAEQAALSKKRKEAVAAHDEALKKKYVKVNRELLKSIDYDSDTPGIEALRKDRRVLAEIGGEKPLTVAELTEELRRGLFHGAERAAEQKKLNARKEPTLDGMLHRKVFRKEALRLGLHKTDSYKSKVREHENAALFETVLRKVVAPAVTLKTDEMKAYYDEHRKDYATPEMMRIKSLVFADRKSAETAAESLNKGADFQWVASQAEGQLDRNVKGILAFDGRPIMTSELPEGARKAVAGARVGDARLYASVAGHFYVLAVEHVVAAGRRPYEEVSQEIARKVLDAKVQKAVEEYAGKLRSLSDVKVYLKAS